jgi:peptide/nickel transport system permease protein
LLVRDPVSVIAVVFLVIVVVLAIGAPWIAPYDPNALVAEPFAGPSSDNWLGADNLGRDTFSRLLYGARPSLLTTFLVAAFAMVVAVPIALAAGYRSGKTDNVVMRLTDALLSVPPLVLAMAVAGVLGAGLRNAVIALTIVAIPGLIRLVRAQALAVREEGFVEASKAVGTSAPVIVNKRVFPHVLSPLIVQISVLLGTILVVEASLGFVGLGTQIPNPSWGGMLREGFNQMATDARPMLVPAIAIALTTLAFNALGDGLRDSLLGSGIPHRKHGDHLGTTTVADVARVAPATATAGAGNGPGAVLEIRDLSVGFDSGNGLVQVLDHVNLTVRKGEILGLVGESGCGKTVTSQSVLRLLPSPPARVLGGEILFEGRDLLRLSAKQLRDVRGAQIGMVFQDPMASLNPAFTIGDQLVEAQRLHRKVSRKAARTRATELLDRVGIPNPRGRLDQYPHTFSGGMRQRVLIAMALANDPKLLIADEPTTALDVTVQAQILELIHSLRDELGMSVMFVTHDLGVVQDLCDRVAVMYAGQVIEESPAADLLAAPQHPYTALLLKSRPRVGAALERLPSIPGVVPSPAAMPEGCRFRERCPYAIDVCAQEPLPLTSLSGARAVRCARHGELDLSTSALLERQADLAEMVEVV